MPPCSCTASSAAFTATSLQKAWATGGHCRVRVVRREGRGGVAGSGSCRLHVCVEIGEAVLERLEAAEHPAELACAP